MITRPIIFAAPMVSAILDGRKTQTRRLATSPLRKCEQGDWLWVRETWGCMFCTDDQKPADIDPRLWSVRYFADDHIRPAPIDGSMAMPEQIKRQRPSIHMPRWASRLTLLVEEVRTEPLQQISENDAIAEGLLWRPALGAWSAMPGDSWNWPTFVDPRRSYAGLWNHLHGPASWDANPNVLVITFRPYCGNVDRIAA